MSGQPKPKIQPKRRKPPRHVPAKMLDALDARDGHVSAWTGRTYVRGSDEDVLVPQHRQGGMGGRPDKHRLSNLVWIESSINSAIKDDAAMQKMAHLRGIAVSIHADPRLIPVNHSAHGGEVYLTDDGRAVPVDEEVPF